MECKSETQCRNSDCAVSTGITIILDTDTAVTTGNHIYFSFFILSTGIKWWFLNKFLLKLSHHGFKRSIFESQKNTAQENHKDRNHDIPAWNCPNIYGRPVYTGCLQSPSGCNLNYIQCLRPVGAQQRAALLASSGEGAQIQDFI